KPQTVITMKLSTLQDLYVHELKDLYSAEKQLVRALPKMTKAATADSLKKAFESHLEETREHVSRLEKALEEVGAGTRGPKCKGMEGLLLEGQDMIEEDGDPEVKD